MPIIIYISLLLMPSSFSPQYFLLYMHFVSGNYISSYVPFGYMVVPISYVRVQLVTQRSRLVTYSIRLVTWVSLLVTYISQLVTHMSHFAAYSILTLHYYLYALSLSPLSDMLILTFLHLFILLPIFSVFLLVFHSVVSF